MENKELTLDEKRIIQLDMLTEFDAFCRQNQLRYSIAYGSLIGAVRHQGFIPWDDDLDLMMPKPDMEIIKQHFRSDNMFYCDIDVDKNYVYAFPRLIHKHTFSKVGNNYKDFGVNIDLYPVLGLPDDKGRIDKFFKKGNKILNGRLFLMRISSFMRSHSIPFATIFLPSLVKNYRNYLYQFPFDNCKYYFSYGGGLHWRNVLDFDPFEKMVEVCFEGEKYKAIAEYDKFLTHFYGDYMTPPPVEKRVPYHGGNYYWKEEK